MLRIDYCNALFGGLYLFSLLQSLLAGYWFISRWFWNLFKFHLCSRCLYFLTCVSVLLYKTIHSSENGVFPAVVRKASFRTDLYLQGSGNSCLEPDPEPSWARIYSEIMVLRAQRGVGLLAATWRSLRDWEGNSDSIILIAPPQPGWPDIVPSSCPENHIIEPLDCSGSAWGSGILGIFSFSLLPGFLEWAQHWSAAVQVLKCWHLELSWDFSCAFTPREGKNPSISWILPLKKNCKVKFR